MRILIAEDDAKIAAFVIKGLRQSGFAVDHAATGEAALAFFRATSYDAAVLDIMLPGLDGLSILRCLREERNLTPVLILSARASIESRVAGLQAGGDDYLTKPFAFAELLARLQALIRRATHVSEPATLTAGDLSMDLLRREVTRAGQRIELQSREFSFLELLMRHPGRPISKTMIVEHVWDYRFDPQTNVVDVLAHRVRAKVDRDYPNKMIQTVRGVGYVLKVT